MVCQVAEPSRTTPLPKRGVEQMGALGALRPRPCPLRRRAKELRQKILIKRRGSRLRVLLPVRQVQRIHHLLHLLPRRQIMECQWKWTRMRVRKAPRRQRDSLGKPRRSRLLPVPLVLRQRVPPGASRRRRAVKAIARGGKRVMGVRPRGVILINRRG